MRSTRPMRRGFRRRYGSSRQHEIESRPRGPSRRTLRTVAAEPRMDAEAHLRQPHAALVACRGDSVIASQRQLQSRRPARRRAGRADGRAGAGPPAVCISACARVASASTCFSAVAARGTPKCRRPAANPVFLGRLDCHAPPAGSAATPVDQGGPRRVSSSTGCGQDIRPCCPPCPAGASGSRMNRPPPASDRSLIPPAAVSEAAAAKLGEHRKHAAKRPA